MHRRACRLIVLVSFTLLFFPLLAKAESSSASETNIAKRVLQVDTYHGKMVEDPYRWMESIKSPQVNNWIDRQKKLSQKYFANTKHRSQLQALLKKYWYYDRYSTPYSIEGKLFFQMNNILYLKESKSAKPIVLIDPNKLSEDGSISLSSYSVSPDSKYLAFLLRQSGSEWQEWRVFDLEKKEVLPDRLKWIQYSNASFTNDSKGFFYSRYDKPVNPGSFERNFYHKLYYHKLGDKQSSDKLIIESCEHKEWGFNGTVSSDGNYLVVHIWDGFKPSNRVYTKDLRQKKSTFQKLFDKADAHYEYVASKDNQFWFKTDLDAPNGKLISVNVDSCKAKTVVAETKDVLVSATTAGGHFFLHYLNDCIAKVKEYGADCDFIGSVNLPGEGAVHGFSGDSNDISAYYLYSDFRSPGTIFEYNLKSKISQVLYQSRIQFDESDYVTERVFVKSTGASMVPMFLTYKRGLVKNGNNPTFLFVYGGFGSSLLPSFSAPMIAWMELGGVFAQASLRGGSEYGEDWHREGKLLKKQNSVDDLISCSKWLIEHKITNRERLAIAGRSNGAMVTSCAMVQNPQLYKAALLDSGLFDMIRFDKSTIGWSWKSEYGSIERKDEFEALFRYSPFHNLKNNRVYPSTLIAVSKNDTRVPPMHSYKFYAQLKHCQSGANPILLRVESNTGHGDGKPINKLVEEWTDKFSFLYKELGLNYFKQRTIQNEK